MKFAKAWLIAGSKFKVRKRRTVMTVVIISALFGVVIGAFMIVRGLSDGLTGASDSVFDDRVVLSGSFAIEDANNEANRRRAVELYAESSDPDKQYPLIGYYEGDESIANSYMDESNVFAQIAMSEYLTRQRDKYRGVILEMTTGHDIVVSDRRTYTLNGWNYGMGADGTGNFNPAVDVIDSDVLKHMIEVESLDTNAIPILASLSMIEKIADVKRPVNKNATNEDIETYLRDIRDEIIGRTYPVEIMLPNGTKEVKYQIVGVLPYGGGISLARATDKFNVLDIVLNQIAVQNAGMVVVDPANETFRANYSAEGQFTSYVDFLLEFATLKEALEFREEYSCTVARNNCSDFFVAEFVNNPVNLNDIFAVVDMVLVIFVIFFTIVAGVIMLAMLNRILDEERQSVALYRAMGAGTGDILQIYFLYVLALCALACVAAVMVGLGLALVVTALNSASLSANVRVVYAILDDFYIALVGFDGRIWLVLGVIMLIGISSVGLASDKIVSKNIAKDLKD